MGSLVLAVGTGSTWAMRAALVLAMSGLTWQEQVFDLEDAKSLARLKRLAPAGLVPWLEHDGVRVHDSLAIAEYVHELCPDRQLYPVSLAERALARSLCAELHAGFRQIRSLLPFFLGAPTRIDPRWRRSVSWPVCRRSGRRRRAPSTLARRALSMPSMR